MEMPILGEMKTGSQESGEPWTEAEIVFSETKIAFFIKDEMISRYELSEGDFARDGAVYRIVGGKNPVFFKPHKEWLLDRELRRVKPGIYGPSTKASSHTTSQPLSSADIKRTLLHKLAEEEKYERPFRSGDLPVLNLFGGSWNEYAQVVFSMAILDTLLNIEEGINRMTEKFDRLLEVDLSEPG